MYLGVVGGVDGEATIAAAFFSDLAILSFAATTVSASFSLAFATSLLCWICFSSLFSRAGWDFGLEIFPLEGSWIDGIPFKVNPECPSARTISSSWVAWFSTSLMICTISSVSPFDLLRLLYRILFTVIILRAIPSSESNISGYASLV